MPSTAPNPEGSRMIECLAYEWALAAIEAAPPDKSRETASDLREYLKTHFMELCKPAHLATLFTSIDAGIARRLEEVEEVRWRPC